MGRKQSRVFLAAALPLLVAGAVAPEASAAERLAEISCPGLQPVDLAVFAAGRQLLVRDAASGHLLAFDASTLKPLGDIDVGGPPPVDGQVTGDTAMVVHEGTGRAFVWVDLDRSPGAERLVVVDLAGKAVVAALDVAGGRLLAADPSGDEVFAIAGDPPFAPPAGRCASVTGCLWAVSAAGAAVVKRPLSYDGSVAVGVEAGGAGGRVVVRYRSGASDRFDRRDGGGRRDAAEVARDSPARSYRTATRVGPCAGHTPYLEVRDRRTDRPIAEIRLGGCVDGHGLAAAIHVAAGLPAERAYASYYEPGDPSVAAVLRILGSDTDLLTRYRLYNPNSGDHHYTTSLGEYLALARIGWVTEGGTYSLYSGPAIVGGVTARPYFRLYNPITGWHHWTTSPNEYQVLSGFGWVQEGTDGHLFDQPTAGTVPLYRLYNPFNGLHHWTRDANEYGALAALGWIQEGIAGHVVPNPDQVVLLEGLAPRQVFPADNWWNQDITGAPVDPGSASYIAFLGAGRGLHPDFGPPPYGIPYVTVAASQPLLPVSFVEYPDESDAGAAGQAPGYPIPDQARVLANYIEGGEPGGGAGGGDQHLLVIDRDRWLLYETWHTRFNFVTSRWEAGSGAVFDLGANTRRPEGWTSADAAGLAIFPGLVRYDEYGGPGDILHAFRVTVRATNGYVWPASHAAGNTPGALPMGARLRLKASKDLSGFPAPLGRVFEAMKRFGLIVADNGSDLYVSGTMDGRWSNDVLNPAFGALTGSDFEVVQLGWR